MQTHTKLANISSLSYMKQLYNKGGEFNTSARSWPIQRDLNVCGVFSYAVFQLELVICYHLTGHLTIICLGLPAAFRNVTVIDNEQQKAAKPSAKVWWCTVAPRYSPPFFCPLWASSFRGTWAMQFLLVLMMCTSRMLGKEYCSILLYHKEKN